MHVSRIKPAVATMAGITLVASVISALAGSDPAPATPANDSSGYLTFYLDNDLFTGTDENYTNGARLSYITQSRLLKDLPWLEKNLRYLSGDGSGSTIINKIWGFEDSSSVEYSYGFALSQLIYTPENLEALTAPQGERPYAGWLGIGLSLHARSEKRLNSVEVSLGVIGPHAQGQEAQDFIHDLRNLPKFQGWDSQIPNEVTFNLHFQQKRRWTDLRKLDLPFDLEIDGFHETGYSLGTALIEAHAGFLIRIGWNLPIEFSDPRLSATSHSQKLYTGKNENTDDWSLYFLLGARGSAVLHDITLDGPVFRDFNTGVKREPWIGEVYAGFGVRYRDWELSFVQTHRSKQFKSQANSQSFGSVAVRKRF